MNDPALQPIEPLLCFSPNHAQEHRLFQGIPGIVRSPGARLWATWYANNHKPGEGADNYVVAVTSDDEGASWSEARVLLDSPGPVRVFDPVLWLDPHRRLWLFYAQSYGQWDGRGGVWAMTCEEPDASVPSWSQPRRLCDGVMMNKPIVLSDRTWMLPVALWHPGHFDRIRDPGHENHVPPDHTRWQDQLTGAFVCCSTDEGQTFAMRGGVDIPDAKHHEHHVVERADGSLWLLSRTDSARGYIAESVSVDGGHTWSAEASSPIPHINSRFLIRRLASGKLLLIKHNPGMDTPWLFRDKVKNAELEAGARSHLTAYLSEDDGKSWYGGLLLDARYRVSYPDADQDADGRIFAIYDYNRTSDREILFATFTEEDVTAGETVSRHARLRQVISKGGVPNR